MSARRADRLVHLPAYLFVEIDRKRKQAEVSGRDLIDLGVGDPDRPTPQFIVDRMAEAVRERLNHGYPVGVGMPEFREAAGDFLARRFGVRLDPAAEIIALIGSKEGLGHLPTAVVNPGDTVLVPDPAYPVFAAGTVLAGGIRYRMPLREADGWVPALDEIPGETLREAKLMFLNYPNNPTTACAPLSFYERAVKLAREYDIVIAQDAAYSEVYFEDRPASILQVKGAKDVCVEFHSLSKTFNMTGWRVGFAAGNAEALAALASVKDHLDSGVFGAIQHAAIEALNGIDRPDVRGQLNVYRRRRDVLAGGLREAGWPVRAPDATFYVWARCPAGYDSMAVVSRILDEADVVVIPGVGFGPCGEGFVRFALTVSEEKIREAVGRIGRMSW